MLRSRYSELDYEDNKLEVRLFDKQKSFFSRVNLQSDYCSATRMEAECGEGRAEQVLQS